jgi:hypothetical protein
MNESISDYWIVNVRKIIRAENQDLQYLLTSRYAWFCPALSQFRSIL